MFYFMLHLLDPFDVYVEYTRSKKSHSKKFACAIEIKFR